MNKSLFVVSLAIALLVCAPSSRAQKYNDGLVDKTIALIGNEMIMLSQVESEAQMMKARGLNADKNARCEIFENMLVSKLFLIQAKLDSLVVNEAAVESSLDGRIMEVQSALGGEKEVEAYFGKPLYKLRQEWRATLSEQSLIQEMQQKVSSNVTELTPSDVEAFYKETPEEDLPMVSTKYRLRQIVIYPDREKANLAVKEKLLELRERIVNGDKFSTLARMYSEDPGSMIKGGELGMMNRNVFWPVFSDAAMALKVGQVSQIVESPDGFHIIQLIAREGDNFNARHILIKPKYTTDDRIKAFDRLDSIRTLIVNDTISFSAAAKIYSQDRKTSTSGGLMADENTGSSYFEKDQLKPADYAALRRMKEGEVSEPIESLDNEGRNGNTVYKILYLEKIIPSHPASFKEDFSELQNQANQKNAMEAIDKFIKEKQKSTYIIIDPLMQGCNFTNKGWLKE